MANALTDADIVKLAQLSKLTLSQEQIKNLKPQLNDILEYVGQLSTLDLSKVPTTAEITGLKNVTATDEVHPSLPNEDAVGQAKNHNGYVVVPAILSEEADA